MDKKKNRKSLTPASQAMIDNRKKSDKGIPRTTEEVQKDFEKFYRLRMGNMITDIKDTINQIVKDSNEKFRDGLILGAVFGIIGSMFSIAFINWIIYSNPPEYAESSLAWGGVALACLICIIFLVILIVYYKKKNEK